MSAPARRRSRQGRGRRRASRRRAALPGRPARRAAVRPSPPGGSTSWSALGEHLSDILQESVAINNHLPTVLDDPLLADDALWINQKKRPVRQHVFLIEDPVAAHELPVGEVAEQRKRQLQGFGERLLREGQVCAGGEVLDAQVFEALVVSLPGQQVRRSRRCEVRAVELEEDPFLTPKVVEGDIATGGARQGEGRRW